MKCNCFTAPKIVETTVSAGLTGGEIAAICLAVLFGILLIVIIIVCCVVQGNRDNPIILDFTIYGHIFEIILLNMDKCI